MFSFFKRGKSKDDGEKKEKSKEKSFSPFSKRQNSDKRETPVVPPETATLFGSSLTSVADNKTPKYVSDNSKENHISDTEPCHNHTLYDSNSSESYDTKTELHTSHEQQYFVPSCDLSPLAEPPCTVISDEDSSQVFERAGSSDRDTVFKTAPNTPVLTKHLTIVTDEVVIEPCTAAENIVTDKTEAVVTIPLGVDLDFPSADEESICAVVPEITKTNTEDLAEAIKKAEEPEKTEVREFEPGEIKMCDSMSHAPGELYDIAEEGTSEEEGEQSEEESEEEDEDDDDEDSGNVTQPTIEEEYPEEIIKKNLVNQEAQLHLQERVSDLTARLSVREAESNKLQCQIEDLQRDVMVKTGGMDRLQAELSAAHKESELVRKRLRKLEEDLDTFKRKNSELAEELQKRSGEINGTGESEGFDFNHLLELEQQVKELTARVKELEGQLENVKQERDKLEREAKEMEAEREEERKIVQEALDEAMAEKEAIQARFEKDFEKLRTVNTDREQKLLDDFEWKLREVEQACKRRLDEKEKQAKLRIMAAEDKLKAAEGELAQMENLRHIEAEASQLRGLNLEQQRSLRLAERVKEQLQVSEKVLQEEVKKLKELLDKEKAALTTMQAIHNREIDEKDRKMRFRLEQQKTELNNQWEEKLRKETIRLRVELDQINRDEKKMVLEAARVEKEGELLKAREKWEREFNDLLKEVEALKQRLANKEEEHKNNIDTVRTNADRDIFELRRKLDRIDLTYQEKIEKIQTEHEREKERLLEESDRKLQCCEQNWQLQLGSTRTTLELVKEQLKREAAEQIQSLHDNHRRQLEEQWEQLSQEKDEALAAMEDRHRASTEKMRAELESLHKCHSAREQELIDMISKMKEEVRNKTALIEDLSTESASFKDNIQDLSQQINKHNEQFQQTTEESEQKLRLVEERHLESCQKLRLTHKQEIEHWRNSAERLEVKVKQLSEQLEESKDSQVIEELRKALSEKEHQVAQLSKEKHLYQLELMNRNCHGETVTARQRRKGGRGKPNKPGSSRGHK